MDLEDIIQKKEWQQLTIEEKEQLRELAIDEQEFNLLKKMLLVAAEEANDTPLINTSVQQNLVKAIHPTSKVINSFKRWYYAAAILLVVISIWYLMEKNQSHKEIVIKEPPKKVIRDTGTTTQENVSQNIPIQKDSLPENKITHSRLFNKNGNNNYAVVNTSIGKNNQLIKFITEVYE